MSPPIRTPDGSEVSEIVLPDGSTASEVIGPDGNVVFETGVLYYNFEDDSDTTTAVDSWNDNNGTISGATYSTDAKVGSSALDFGGDDYVALPTAEFESIYPNFSFAIWVSIDDLASQNRLLEGSPSGDSSTEFFSRWNHVDDRFEFSVQSNAAVGGTGTNDYTLITGTVGSSGDITLYQDDSEIGSASGSLSSETFSDVYVGRSPNFGGGLDGRGDAFKLYDKELSSTEVSNLFNTGSISG